MKFGITKLTTCQFFSNFGAQQPPNGGNFSNTSLLIVPFATDSSPLSPIFRRSIHSSMANSAPQIGNDAAGERRAQAESIRERIPKSLSPFAVYIKDNFRSVETAVGRMTEKSPSARRAHVFQSLVDGFKNLPSDERTHYKRKADATRDAHQTALKSLTEEEKQMLKIESRRKKLKRKIISSQRELNALKQKLEYPAGSVSCAYLAFASEQEKLPGTKAPDMVAKIEMVKSANFLNAS
uniref:HMG box domain-containing protein n=1 Tax=Romanomermis culicivorax TaxID=13658 RepID=A0A915KJW8_ROMCU